MKKHIHIFGASGSGTTTIARKVSEQLSIHHFDSDNYYWLFTDPPFTQERDNKECMRMLKQDLETADAWILSGSVTGWGDEIVSSFDLVVFVYVPTQARIERIKKREKERYGERILPGGDRYQSSNYFVEWAAAYDAGTKSGRNLKKHEDWLKTITCPVIRIINHDLNQSAKTVIQAISQTNE